MQLGDYIINADTIREENRLKDFLARNDFRYCRRFEYDLLERGYLIVVNTIHRTYFNIDKYFLTGEKLSVDEFFRKINCYGKASRKKIYSDANLLYEGYVINDRPYGLGTLYYENGNKYWQGIFDVKGIVEGKEYYQNGQVKFEGVWNITTGYGPNAPHKGNLFSQNGNLIFSGKFEINKYGVGAPMIRYPKFPWDIENRPKIESVRNEDLKWANVKSRSDIINERFEIGSDE